MRKLKNNNVEGYLDLVKEMSGNGEVQGGNEMNQFKRDEYRNGKELPKAQYSITDNPITNLAQGKGEKWLAGNTIKALGTYFGANALGRGLSTALTNPLVLPIAAGIEGIDFMGTEEGSAIVNEQKEIDTVVDENDLSQSLKTWGIGPKYKQGGSLPKAQMYNSELTGNTTEKNYNLSINRPIFDSNGKCWSGCGQRKYDPFLNWQLGTSLEGNYSPEDELAAAEARLWTGLTLNADQTGKKQAGLKTYLGANAGGKAIYNNLLNEYNIHPTANIVGNIGFEGDAEDAASYATYKRGRRGDPLKWGYGATIGYDLLNNQGIDLGAYLNFDKMGINFNYNPKSNMKTLGLQFGLPNKKTGGTFGHLNKYQTGDETYPTQADIDEFHALNAPYYKQELLYNQGNALVNKANELVEHDVDIWRPPVGTKENIIDWVAGPFKDCFYNNSCVEAVKNVYKWSGYDSGIPDNVYTNKEFLDNYKDYGYEKIDIKDVNDLIEGDVLQYYDRDWSKYQIVPTGTPTGDAPYHMGVYVGNGQYFGDGSKDAPSLISDIFVDETGENKDPFRVFRRKNPTKIKRKFGGDLPKAQSSLETSDPWYLQNTLPYPPNALADNTSVHPDYFRNNIPIADDVPHVPYVDKFGSTSGSFYPSGPEPTLLQKIKNAAANPLGTFGYSVRNEEIPYGYIPRHGNAFDTFIGGIVNPFSWWESGEAAIDDFQQGNILGGTLETLGALPVVPATIGATKKLLPVVSDATASAKNVIKKNLVDMNIHSLSTPAPRATTFNKHGQIKTSFDDQLKTVNKSGYNEVVREGNIPARDRLYNYHNGHFNVKVRGNQSIPDNQWNVQITKKGSVTKSKDIDNGFMQLVKSENGVYHLDMSMPNRMDAGQAMNYLSEYVPKGAIIKTAPNGSLSLDSYKLITNQIKRGKFSYVPNDRTIQLNMMSKDMAKIDVNNAGMVTKTEADKIVENVNKMLDNAGIKQRATATNVSENAKDYLNYTQSGPQSLENFLTWKVEIPELALKVKFKEGGELPKAQTGYETWSEGGEAVKHTIVKGDTGKRLKAMYGTELKDILKHNDLTYFKLGDEIEIPKFQKKGSVKQKIKNLFRTKKQKKIDEAHENIEDGTYYDESNKVVNAGGDDDIYNEDYELYSDYIYDEDKGHESTSYNDYVKNVELYGIDVANQIYMREGESKLPTEVITSNPTLGFDPHSGNFATIDKLNKKYNVGIPNKSSLPQGFDFNTYDPNKAWLDNTPGIIESVEVNEDKSTNIKGSLNSGDILNGWTPEWTLEEIKHAQTPDTWDPAMKGTGHYYNPLNPAAAAGFAQEWNSGNRKHGNYGFFDYWSGADDNRTYDPSWRFGNDVRNISDETGTNRIFYADKDGNPVGTHYTDGTPYTQRIIDWVGENTDQNLAMIDDGSKLKAKWELGDDMVYKYVPATAGAILLGPEALARGWQMGTTNLTRYAGTSLFDALGYYGGYEGATHLPEDLQTFIDDPSWSNAVNPLLDILGVAGGVWSGTNFFGNFRHADKIDDGVNLIKGTKIPKVSDDFVSDINWSKWNKDMPTSQIDEYNHIEKITKQRGTYMKNTDGSDFAGSPEQFIQMKSKNFNISYPEGSTTVYRGQDYADDFLETKNFGFVDDAGTGFDGNSKVYKGKFTGDKNIASQYGKHGENKKFYELAMKNNSKNSMNLNAMGKDYGNLDFIGKPKSYFQNAVKDQQKIVDKLTNTKTESIIVNGNFQNLEESTQMLERYKRALQNYDKMTSNPHYMKLVDDINSGKFTQRHKDFLSTDDLALWLEQNNLDNIVIDDIYDYAHGTTNISNQAPGNYLKSLEGNIGTFDLTNPSIYKQYGDETEIPHKAGTIISPLQQKLMNIPKNLMNIPKYASRIWNWRDQLSKNLNPFGYQGSNMSQKQNIPENRLWNAIVKDKAENTKLFMEDLMSSYNHYKNTGEIDDNGHWYQAEMGYDYERDGATIEDMLGAHRHRTDMLHLSLGMDQKYNTVKESKYKPTKAKDDNVTYYQDWTDELAMSEELTRYFESAQEGETFNPAKFYESIGATQDKKGNWHRQGSGMGEHLIDFGEDEKGTYLSYYDIYDLNPFGETAVNRYGVKDKLLTENQATKLQEFIGAPGHEMYGRIYFDFDNKKITSDLQKYQNSDKFFWVRKSGGEI